MKVAHAGLLLKDDRRTHSDQNSATRASGVRFRTGNIFIYLLSFILVGSATAKLLHLAPVVSGMAVLGFSHAKLFLIAILEIVSALLFAYPRKRNVGLLMVSAYLGGAIAVHVGHDQLPLQPAFVLALIWLGVWLRYPQRVTATN